LTVKSFVKFIIHYDIFTVGGLVVGQLYRPTYAQSAPLTRPLLTSRGPHKSFQNGFSKNSN